MMESVFPDPVFSMDPGDLLTSSPRNPFRPLDWRWHRAKFTVNREPSRRRGIDDRWVARARRFLEAVVAGPKQRRSRGPRIAILQAQTIRFGNFVELRIEIESRLLADQDDATIADRCRMTADVVAAYAALFFDVRPVLSSSDYILFAGVGIQPQNLHNETVAVDYKLAAYFGGPQVVDTLFATSATTSERQATTNARLFQLWVRTRRSPAKWPCLKRLARLLDLIERLGDRDREPLPMSLVRDFVSRPDLTAIRAQMENSAKVITSVTIGPPAIDCQASAAG